MGSRAPQAHAVPGPPSQVELAYLAGLFDRGGGLTLSPLGLKIKTTDKQADWLTQRFGGHWRHDGFWSLTKQSELWDALARIDGYVLNRGDELRLMLQLLTCLRQRQSYHGDDEWRALRDGLMARLRSARRTAPPTAGHGTQAAGRA